MLYLGAIKEEIPSEKLKNICLGITSYLINKFYWHGYKCEKKYSYG